jgi:glycosyltransferase involved in cell wall biosynthesis
MPARGDRPLTVLYYGNYVPLHGVEFIIEAAQRLRDDPRFRFIMVGSGQARTRALALYTSNPSGNVAFMGRVADDELDRLITESDICMGIFGTSVKAQLVVSNKVWQCLAMGRPVITGNGPGAASVLHSGEHCLLVPHGDAGGLVDALRQLADDPALAARIAENGARLVREQFTSITVARRLIGVVGEVRTSRLAADSA